MNSKPTILIIDDEYDLGEILGDYLEDDFQCQVLSEPSKALEKIKEEHFSLIISDLHMPDVSGMDIIAKAKEHQPSTPIILLTGSSKDDPVVREALEAGASGVITKPFRSPAEVIEYLKETINK